MTTKSPALATTPLSVAVPLAPVEPLENSSAPAWLPTVVKKLEELADLPPDWNSYGAAPVKRTCLQAALRLLRDVMKDNSPAPAVVPTPRGTVLLEWHRRGIDLEIDVLGTDCFHVVVEDAATGIESEFDAGTDPTEVVRIIERLS